MKTSTMIAMCVCVAIALVGATTANAAVILEHLGDNDPVGESIGAAVWQRVGTAGTANAVGKPNWFLDYGAGSNYYRETAAPASPTAR